MCWSHDKVCWSHDTSITYPIQRLALSKNTLLRQYIPPTAKLYGVPGVPIFDSGREGGREGGRGEGGREGGGREGGKGGREGGREGGGGKGRREGEREGGRGERGEGEEDFDDTNN